MTAREFLPGIFPDMPAPEYFSVPAMSASGAKKMLRSQAHYLESLNRPSDPTPNMIFGSATHTGALEPWRFVDEVVAAPELNLRTKAGKESRELFNQEHAGKIILSPDDHARCVNTIAAVRRHPAAAKLLDGATIEQSLFWLDAKFGVPCKARWDAWNHGIIVDFKTCQDASPEAFGRSCATYSYDVQAAQYISAAEHVLNESPRAFCFIAVETEPPHAVAVYAAQSDMILAGRHRMDIALERYREIRETGTYLGYADLIQPLKFPKWATRFDIGE